MYVKKQIDGSVTVGNVKHDETWVEFTLPAGEVDESNLTWIDTPLPVVDATKIVKNASKDIEIAIYELLDKTALSFGFKSPLPMDRASGYVTSKILKYNTFAVTLTDWRDAIFDYVEAEEVKILNGLRTMPTVDEMLAELAIAFPTPVKP